MKKLLILGITAILTLSFIGCTNNSKSENIRNNDESKIVSNDTNNTSKDKTSDNVDNANSNKIVDKKIAVEDATNINISVNAAIITIKVYDGDEIKVTGKLSENSTDIDLDKHSSTIELIEKGTKISKFLPTMTNDQNQKDVSTLDILIPLKFNGNFQFIQGVGTSNIEGLNVKNLDIYGGTGYIKCEDIVFNKLNLKTGAAKTDFKLNKKSGDMIIEGGVGEINITMAEVGGNLKYSGGVGKLDVKIPENSPVKFEKNSGSGLGAFKLNAKTSSEEKYTFDLKVGVGSIDIHN